MNIWIDKQKYRLIDTSPEELDQIATNAQKKPRVLITTKPHQISISILNRQIDGQILDKQIDWRYRQIGRYIDNQPH